MLPKWKTKSDNHGVGETTNEVIDMHMKSCNKSAIVVDDSVALQLFTILTSLKQPVYFQKDVPNKNLEGYKFNGYFPASSHCDQVVWNGNKSTLNGLPH